jgi:hypothetical protein
MSFAERAAEKVRNAGQVAGAVQLFIRTDPFAQDAPQKSVSGSATFHRPTSDTRDIGAAVMRIRVPYPLPESRHAGSDSIAVILFDAQLRKPEQGWARWSAQ